MCRKDYVGRAAQPFGAEHKPTVPFATFSKWRANDVGNRI